MKVVVTGASGYIGSYFIQQLLSRGHDVVVASRNQLLSSTLSWIYFDLLSEDPIALPQGTDVVVHLAAITSQVNFFDEHVEVIAAQRLITSAENMGARFIFVSSQTAHVDAPTAYGRIKWRIELNVSKVGGWIVRPGLVYGGAEKGLFGTLTMYVRQLVVLPVFLPSPKIQPIHVSDLVDGLINLTERDSVPPGIFCLASPEPVSFHNFLAIIATCRIRRKRWFLPTPIFIIQGVRRILGTALCSRLGLERLNSLFNLPKIETVSDLNQLNLVLRPLSSGMHRSGNHRRRQLLSEGLALMSYILKERPSSRLLRHYVRAIEKMRDGFSLALPDWLLNRPALLVLLEGGAFKTMQKNIEFSWRLDAAMLLAEATPQGARRFINYHHRDRRWGSLIAILLVLMTELQWRILRLICKPFVWFLMRSTRERDNNG